ncbi:hypothetical protein YN1_7080 [Nanoarchaeota archaeon]
MNINKIKLLLKSEYFYLFLVVLLLSIDITRFGNIYNIDPDIFPYFNNIVSYKYFLSTFYNYNPWLGNINNFSIVSFISSFPLFLFSHIILSFFFLYLFLSFIGSIFVYKMVKEIIGDNSIYSKISGILSVIFYIIAPQFFNLTYGDPLGIYQYYTIPIFLYSIRKYFVSNFKESIGWFFIFILTGLLLFYYNIPVYALPFFILFLIFFIYYSIVSIRKKYFGRVILLLSLIFGFFFIKYSFIIYEYNLYTSNMHFLRTSFQFWMGNSQSLPLLTTLTGNHIFYNPLYQYIFIFILPIIYSFIILNKKVSKNKEILFFFISFLIFTFLYSMPNVPFSSFWENLFYKYPIMVDLRTQYIIIAPFQGFLMVYLIGFGIYGILDYIKDKLGKIKKYIIYILLPIIILGSNADLVLFGSPSIVYIPSQFLNTVNYINSHTSYTNNVIIYPIFVTENSETWYKGNNIFSLFLKPNTILGGYYYSVNSYIENIIYSEYMNIYNSDTSKNAINYNKNFFYLFNVKYIIFEKDAINTTILPIYPYTYFVNNTVSGLNNYQNLGIISLVYNNSLYSVYSTNTNSSLIFLSYNNYPIDYLLNSDNITGLLIPLEIEYISPIEYKVDIDPEYLDKKVYLYFMIPYVNGWNIEGGELLNETNYYGYTQFIIIPENNTIILYNPLIQNSINKGLLEVFLEILLPLILSGILYKFRNKIPEIKYF